jgi:hypothetical protein
LSLEHVALVVARMSKQVSVEQCLGALKVSDPCARLDLVERRNGSDCAANANGDERDQRAHDDGEKSAENSGPAKNCAHTRNLRALFAGEAGRAIQREYTGQSAD